MAPARVKRTGPGASHPGFIPTLLLCLTLCTLTGSATAAEESPLLMAAARGDLTRMPVFFASLPAQTTPLLQQLRSDFDARFVRRSEALSPQTGEPTVDAVVVAFRRYWIDALTDPGRTPAAERRLEDDLAALLQSAAGAAPADRTPANTVFDSAADTLRRRGYGVSVTTQAPIHDLVVWKDERRTHYRVDLTDGAETVEVVFIDGLVSAGWRNFASLGLTATTGWTRGGALYCVGWAYDTQSQNFRVSYLKHEARHFADFRRFPGLDEATMEYRAKLTELVYSGLSAGTLLRRFFAERSADGDSAHARANDRVARAVYMELHGRPMPQRLDPETLAHADRIDAAARRLLERNTQALLKQRG